MSIQKKYSGIVVPAVTPLTENFQLDHGAVESMFDNFYRNHVLPFILGTTGESASLPFELKADYVRQAGKNKQKGTILYAGIASNCLEESIKLTKISEQAGVDVVAATLPSYYALTESQIKRYFEQLADAIPLPLIIYNIPATTHSSVPLKIIDELSYHSNIIGLKDSERNIERLHESLNLWRHREDFSHFMGWAAKSAEAMLLGSDGIIPSTGNFIPSIYHEMQEAVIQNDTNKALRMQELSDLYGSLYQKSRTLGESLWALKVLMSTHQLCQPIVMPPLQGSSQEDLLRLQEAYAQALESLALSE
ncbi:dihydrodipicolinate synthase family protein [Flectobacillus longus]|uniref:dihydrodipicolinate synthase family protein n=1 Tax=Flectobacillus longus TaxID=2984207 RepID=UPI0024B832E6|nr:dihydrodipicolinate synthase family protein [Flectobacillus longus]MDI9879318.1 dihydrodipicolinate synthase family protein [Flectobacillus longus]